jgi:hypothetical protein
MRMAEITVPSDHPLRKCAEADTPRIRIDVHGDCYKRYQASLRRETMPDDGPGTELHNMLHAAGIRPTGCAGKCHARMQQMNKWGVEGCREHRAEIIAWMRGSYREFTVREKLSAAKGAVASGLAPSLISRDVFGAMIDEAIRRARE